MVCLDASDSLTSAPSAILLGVTNRQSECAEGCFHATLHSLPLLHLHTFSISHFKRFNCLILPTIETKHQRHCWWKIVGIVDGN